MSPAIETAVHPELPGSLRYGALSGLRARRPRRPSVALPSAAIRGKIVNVSAGQGTSVRIFAMMSL